MSGEDDIEPIESSLKSTEPSGDSVVSETNEGRAALVNEQKAQSRYVKEGGRSGITGEFGKPEFIDSAIDGKLFDLPNIIPDLPDLIPDLPQLPDLPELPDLPDLPDLPGVPDLIPDIPDLIPDLPGLPDLIPDIPDLIPNLPDLPDLPDLIPDIPDLIPDLPDIFPDRPDEGEEREKPEGAEEEPDRVLTPEDFDELGEDVARALREMGVERVEITDLGDTTRMRLHLAEEREIPTNREDVKSIGFAKTVEMEFSLDENGKIEIKNIEGITAEVSGKVVSESLAGQSVEVDINSLSVEKNEDGTPRAKVNAGSFPLSVDREFNLPPEVHDRLKVILDRLD